MFVIQIPEWNGVWTIWIMVCISPLYRSLRIYLIEQKFRCAHTVNKLSVPDQVLLVSYPDPPSMLLQEERGSGEYTTTLLYLWKFGWDDLIGWCGNYLTCTGLPYRKPPSFTHHTRPTDLYLATCAKSLDVEPHSQALVLEGEKKPRGWEH